MSRRNGCRLNCKESGRETRYTVGVGESFDDLRQPNRCEVWQGLFWRFLKWAGTVTLATATSKVVAILIDKVFG